MAGPSWLCSGRLNRMARATRIMVDLPSWKEAWDFYFKEALAWREREVLVGGIPSIYPTIHPCIWQMLVKPVLGWKIRRGL